MIVLARRKKSWMIDQTLNNTVFSNVGESRREHCFRIVQSCRRHELVFRCSNQCVGEAVGVNLLVHQPSCRYSLVLFSEF